MIAESTTDGIFLTEKTWHAILIAKPFVVVGATGLHKFLEEKGFELYTELFDYSFDSVSNEDERIKLICDNLQRLSEKDYTDLCDSVQEKCYRNQKLALSMVKNQKDVPKMALESNYCCTIIKEAQCRLDT